METPGREGVAPCGRQCGRLPTVKPESPVPQHLLPGAHPRAVRTRLHGNSCLSLRGGRTPNGPTWEQPNTQSRLSGETPSVHAVGWGSALGRDGALGTGHTRTICEDTTLLGEARHTGLTRHVGAFPHTPRPGKRTPPSAELRCGAGTGESCSCGGFFWVRGCPHVHGTTANSANSLTTTRRTF